MSELLTYRKLVEEFTIAPNIIMGEDGFMRGEYNIELTHHKNIDIGSPYISCIESHFEKTYRSILQGHKGDWYIKSVTLTKDLICINFCNAVLCEESSVYFKPAGESKPAFELSFEIEREGVSKPDRYTITFQQNDDDDTNYYPHISCFAKYAQREIKFLADRYIRIEEISGRW